jgi:acyl carrier protein
MLGEASITARLQDVFEQVFEVESFPISRELTADSVEAWDSLLHVRLILAVENEFGVNFTAAEIEDLPNVGRLIDLITSKV